jgi:hypothetical protein
MLGCWELNAWAVVWPCSTWYSRCKELGFPCQNSQVGEWQDSVNFSTCPFILDFWKIHFVNMRNTSSHYDLNPTLNCMALHSFMWTDGIPRCSSSYLVSEEELIKIITWVRSIWKNLSKVMTFFFIYFSVIIFKNNVGKSETWALVNLYFKIHI